MKKLVKDIRCIVLKLYLFNIIIHSTQSLSLPSKTVSNRKWLVFPPPISSRINPLLHHPSKTTQLFLSDQEDSPTSKDTSTNKDAEEEDEQWGAWVPVGSATALQDVTPTPVQIMGRNYVVWNNSSQWSVFADACPHRLAPLSQGRIDPDTGCLECPYHGWQFDVDGYVTKLPQLDSDEIPRKKVRAKSLKVHLVGDLIFAFLPEKVHGEMFPSSLLPEDMTPYLKGEKERDAVYFVRDLPYSFDFLIENFMDPAHVPFAHHGLQSVRDDGSSIPMKLVVSNFTHVEVLYQDISRGKPRDGVVAFQRPFYYHYRTKREDQTYQPDLVIHCVPVSAGRSRVIYSPQLSIQLPDFLLHAGGNRFLNTDTWLHDAERSMRCDDGKYVLPSKSDVGCVEFRNWWKKHGFAKAPPNTFGPASKSQLERTKPLSRRQQIDPWEHHSKHCSTCRKSLKRLKTLQKGGGVLAFSSLLLVKRSSILAFLVSMTGLGVRYFCDQCATFIEGNPSPSGVGDRSYSAEKE